jgi:hypothetical protein
MAIQVCPRCHRANPKEAVFCHFDGIELRAVLGAARLPQGHLPHEFVFPSGRACQTYDELSQGCQEEWAEARTLLQRGVFEQFLTGTGRLDLVEAAQKARAHADADIGLHSFINSLPGTHTEGPRLDLHPRRLLLGTLLTGETREVPLTILNQGTGLLHGTLSVAIGNDWLKIGAGNGHCSLKTARQQQVKLRVNTQGLVAPKVYSAKLTVITNGGIVEVPVSLELAAYPFPRAPFEDAGSPREMAELMRKQPKAAVTLLESGEVRRWFEANGWTYPVSGPTAPGVAAVQQFFEGMGLSKPPALQLSEDQVHFTCVHPEVVRGNVALRAGTKKWVYAYSDSDASWLKVTTPTVSGPQQTVIGFEIDSGLLEPNQTHLGTVQITANAGQRLVLRVWVDVRRPHEPFTRRLLRPFFVGALLALVFRLLLAAPADVQARVLASSAPAAGSFPTWLESPLADPQSAEHFIRHFVLSTWWLGSVMGFVLLWRQRSHWSDTFFGGIAGAVVGISGGASLACLLALIDSVPRIAWRELNGVIGGTRLAGAGWLWTPAWIILASLCWTVVGALAGFLLRIAGPAGVECLAGAARPVAWLCALFGLKRVASFLTLQ